MASTKFRSASNLSYLTVNTSIEKKKKKISKIRKTHNNNKLGFVYIVLFILTVPHSIQRPPFYCSGFYCGSYNYEFYVRNFHLRMVKWTLEMDYAYAVKSFGYIGERF